MWKPAALLIVACGTVLLSGCWDSLDIERNGFVMATAIDLAEDDENTLMLTNQLAVPNQMSNKMGGGGSEGKAFSNMTVKGDSMMSMVRRTALQASRVPSFEHMKVLVISSEVVKKKNMFTSVLDFFLRDTEMRRTIKVIIKGEHGGKGKAKDILSQQPEIEQLPALYIDKVTENVDKTIRMLPATSIGDVQGEVLQDFSYVMPKIELVENHFKYSGASVFKGVKNKMIGTLSPKEVLGLNLITKTNKNSVLKFKVNNQKMVYELDYSKPSIDIDPENPKNMDVTISLQTQGRVAEMYGGKSLLQKDYMKEIQHSIAQQVETYVKETVDKLQNELNTDVIGINKKLSNQHPKVWEKIKADWEKGNDYFTNADIHVKANAEIQDIGATDKSKEKRRGE